MARLSTSHVGTTSHLLREMTKNSERSTDVGEITVRGPTPHDLNQSVRNLSCSKGGSTTLPETVGTESLMGETSGLEKLGETGLKVLAIGGARLARRSKGKETGLRRLRL